MQVKFCSYKWIIQKTAQPFAKGIHHLLVQKKGVIYKVMNMKSIIKFRSLLIPFICLINIILIAYTTWDKYRTSSCAICHNVPYLPINEKTLAILAIASILLFLILYYFSDKFKIIAYISLFFSIFFVGFSSFLQISRYELYQAICTNCVISSILYCFILVIMLYDIILKPIWKMNP